MSKRLTRKQIKHDIRDEELQTALSHTLERIRSHPRIIAYALAGVLALVVLVAAGRAWLTYERRSADDRLVEAIKIYEAPIRETGADPDDPNEPSFSSDEERRARAREVLQQVNFGISRDVASLYLAELALAEGDTATARKLWAAYLAKHRGDLLAVSVRINLIHLDRQEGRSEELAEELRAELNGSPEKSLPEDVLLFELGQTLDALERNQEALELYQRLIEEYPRSPFAAEARTLTPSAS